MSAKPHEQPDQDARLFKVCDVCGQPFDTNDADQVFHHDGAPHQPLPPQSGR